MCEGARISWCLKKKFVMALSSCEAEYIIASMSFCQATFLDTLIQEIKVKSSFYMFAPSICNWVFS